MDHCLTLKTRCIPWLRSAICPTGWTPPTPRSNRYFQALFAGPREKYCNAGILLIQSPRFIAQNLYQRIIDFLREKPDLCKFGDQSAINGVLRGNWDELSPRWNWPITRLTRDLVTTRAPKITHFVSDRKPWKDTFMLQDPAIIAEMRRFLAGKGLEDALYQLNEDSFKPSAERQRVKQLQSWAKDSLAFYDAVLPYLNRTDFIDTAPTPTKASQPPVHRFREGSTKMRSLTEIANAYGSDKGSLGLAHHYTLLYDMLFHAQRHQNIHLLEMGLQVGGPEIVGGATRKPTDAPSVRMWKEYFPNARITGLDYSDFSALDLPEFSFIQCDLDDRENIAQAAHRITDPIDIVIDDASHASRHQQHAFLAFFPKVKPGGLYIIEDLHWQPEHYEIAAGHPPKMRDVLRYYMQKGRFDLGNDALTDEFNALRDQISFIYVYQQRFKNKGPDKVAVIHKSVS